MKKILFGIILVFTMTSCISMALRYVGAFKETAEIKTLSNKEKEIVFIPMHHIGKKEFYEDVAQKVDSFQNLGYTVFYEGTAPKTKDKEILHTTNLKWRKITGYHLSKKGFLDTLNNTILGTVDYDNKHNLINQPSYHDLKVDTAEAMRADIEKHILIQRFEEKHGQIKLQECDFQTPLDSIYNNCKIEDKTLRKNFKRYVIHEIRNENLARTIAESPEKKILVIYGKSHYKPLLKELKKIDKSWKR